MVKKEARELWRSYRFLLVPLVFLFPAVLEPVTFKLMPSLLQNTNLPPGTIIRIPPPAPGDVLRAIVDQFNQMGILAILFLGMGTVAREKAGGAAAMVLVKPLGRGEYLLAKLAVLWAMAAVSLALAMAAGGYYTARLIGPVHPGAEVAGTALYLPYLLMVVAATVLCSTLFRSQTAAGGAALGLIVLISALPSLWQVTRLRSPAALIRAADTVLATGTVTTAGAAVPLAVTMALTLGFAMLAVLVLRRQEL